MQNKLKILFGILFVALLTTSTAGISYIGDITINSPNSVTEGEKFKLNASAEGNGLKKIKIGEKLSEDMYNWIEEEDCLSGDNSQDYCSIEIQEEASEVGTRTYAVKVFAETVDPRIKTEKVEIKDSGLNAVSLDSVAATRYDVSNGDSTKLQATVVNSDQGYGRRVTVKWYARNTYDKFLDQTTETVGSGSTEQLNSGFLGRNELVGRGLEVGKPYTVKAKLFVNGKVVGKKTADRKLTLVEEKNQKPEITLKQPSGMVDDTYPKYVWKIEDDQNEMKKVKLVVDDDSDPFSNPLHEKDLPLYRETGQKQSYFHRVGWGFLERGKKYFWGLKVSDGENQKTKSISFTVKEKKKASIRNAGPSGNVKNPVTLWIEPNQKLENSRSDYSCYASTNDPYVTEGRDHEMRYRSDENRFELEKKFSTGKKTVYFKCFGPDREMTNKVNTTFTVKKEQDTEDPIARLNVPKDSYRTGELVTFDASDSKDNRGVVRYEYDFDNDGVVDKTTSKEKVTVKFQNEYTGFAKVTAFDEAGNSDVAYDWYKVREKEESEKGTLEVIVQDSEGDDPDAKVTVDGTAKWTGGDGKASFQLEEGSYDVKASKSGYITDSKTVEVDRGETSEVTLELRKKTGKASIVDYGPSGDVENPVDLYVELDGDSQDYSCYASTNNKYVTEGIDHKLELQNQKFKLAKNFAEGQRKVYFQCFNQKTSYETQKVSTKFTVDSEDQTGITPKLEVKPYLSETGETVTFNASGSSAEAGIDYYRFDLDNDGSYEVKRDYDGVYKKSFSDSYSGYARVKVVDENGDSAKAKAYYIVEEAESGSLRVTVKDRGRDELENAQVRVENGDYRTKRTGYDGEVFFSSLEENRYSVKATCEGKTVSDSVYVSSGENEEISLELESNISDDYCDAEDENGELTVNVKSRNGDKLNARVRVDGESKRTYGDGKVTFSNLPRERLDVEVSKSGYRTEHRDVDLRYDREKEIDVTLYPVEKQCGVSRRDVSFWVTRTTIDRGESTTLKTRVSNTGSENQRVKVKFKVGSSVVDTETNIVPAGGSQTFTEEVSPESSTFGRAVVSTQGGPCGDREFDQFSSEITVLSGGDDKPENERPVARFSYSPNNPKTGEEVEFDASSSSDDNGIVSYSWRFGDGSTNAGRTVTHTFDEPGSYPVRLKVEDSGGKTDTRLRYVTVGEPERKCGISQRNLQFSLDDYTIERGESTKAELRIFNTAGSSQTVEVKFKVGSSVVEERTVNVPAFDSRTLTQRVSPSGSTFIRAKVSTEDGPCGNKQFDQLNEEITVLSGDSEDAQLDVKVENKDGFPVEDARVKVRGPENRIRFTDGDGDAGFSLQPGRYTVEVSHPDYMDKEKSVRLDEGESKDLRFELGKREEGKGSLKVTVKDGSGNWIEDARIRVENGDDRIARTDSYGFADLRLDPGRYDIEVTHPDYEDTAEGTVYIEEGETDSRTFRLYRDQRSEGLEITSVDYPGSVCRGDTLSVEYAVRNSGEYDESVQTTASGFGSNIVTNTFVVEEGEKVSGTIRFTDVEGSGQEEFSIRVENGTADSLSRTVTVEDCAVNKPGRNKPSGVSMKLSYPIPPNKALVGDTVKVSGFVDGVRGRTEVTIYVNGNERAHVSTQPDGYYQTYIRAESIGTKTIRAKSGGASASRTLEVLPTASVGFVDAPQKVFEGESYEVCANVRSQVEAKVLLIRDGRIVESTNANGEVCFNMTASQPGTHMFEVRALTSGEGSSSTQSVTVLETGVETTSFPGQIASVESGDGMVKVELYNTHHEPQRYKLSLKGLPDTWLSQSTKEVVLSTGERKTVYFYLTPRKEGTYSPELVVTSDNQDIYRQEVSLEVGGQKEPRSKGLIEALSEFLPF